MCRASLLLTLALLTACDGHVYVRDGLTDGDTFYLPAYVHGNEDPVLQSWVAYSLSRSVCQLDEGGDNPARNRSFDCEFLARMSLVEQWAQFGGNVPGNGSAPVPSADAEYLDLLARVRAAGFLREYIWHYLHRRDWQAPDDLRAPEFDRWRHGQLPPDHQPMTRVIGFWGPGQADFPD